MPIGVVEAPPQGPGREQGDDELVREARAGAVGRFALLVRRHRERLRRVAHGVVRDRAEADDVVQQAFLRAFVGLGGWASSAPFAVWLTRIAVNEALMRLRRSRRLARATQELAVGPPGSGPTPEQEAAAREEVARLGAALVRLSPRHREILQLTALQGRSRADAARRLGVSEAAAKVRLHRARAALRRLLREPARARPPQLVLAPGRRRLIGWGTGGEEHGLE
jgi:RNA polymerase sigma-70 factor (ECF subfamily)